VNILSRADRPVAEPSGDAPRVKQRPRLSGWTLAGLASAVVLLVGPVLWFITLATPSDEAVRLRNSLLADVGPLADFTWLPADIPGSYLLERGPVPAEFTRIYSDIFAAGMPESDFEKALAIARHLDSAPNAVGGALMETNLNAYHQIITTGRGYCGDYTQVFNAIAIAGGIPVREWGIGFDGFASGHAFNEIFDRQSGRWMMIDAFHSLYFADADSRQPLSVLEIRERLHRQGTEQKILVLPIVEKRFAFRSIGAAEHYYSRGMDQLFLWWGNNVFTYERSRLVELAGRASRSAEQLTAIMLGVHPHIHILADGTMSRDIDILARAQRRLWVATAVLLAGWTIAFIQLWLIWRARRDSTPGAPRPAP